MSPAPMPAVIEDSLESLFADALDVVATDVPEAYARLGDELGDIVLALHLGDERFALRHGQTTPPQGEADAELTTSATTLAQLVGGRIALTAALADRTITMLGAPRALAAVDRALRLLVHGIVRSPAAPDLMRRLEQLAHLERVVSDADNTEHQQPKEPT